MSKNAVYLILFIFSIYFSFVVGKILGDLEGYAGDRNAFEGQYNGVVISEQGSRSISDYLNPFSDFSLIPTDPYGYDDGLAAQSPRRRSYEIESYSHGNSGGGGAFSFGSNDRQYSAGGGGGNIGAQPLVTMRGGGSNSRSSGYEHQSGNGIPFNGLHELSRGGSGSPGVAIAASGNGSANATGTIGARMGPFSSSGNQTQSFGPPNPPGQLEPIPLDKGAIVTLVLSIIFGGYFIRRSSRKMAISN